MSNAFRRLSVLMPVLLVGQAQATYLDFETNPLGTQQTVNGYIGDAYDLTGVNLRSEGYNRPAWHHGVYGNSGWFLIAGARWTGSGWDRDHLGMDFPTAASDVSFKAFCLANVRVQAYGAANNLLADYHMVPNATWKLEQLHFAEPIARIELRSATFDTVLAFDDLTFVPDPATVLLFLLGPAVMSRRRRCKAALSAHQE